MWYITLYIDGRIRTCKAILSCLDGATTGIRLDVTWHVDVSEEKRFKHAVKRAEQRCPITKLFRLQPVLTTHVVPETAPLR